jgi:O-antigen ligase
MGNWDAGAPRRPSSPMSGALPVSLAKWTGTAGMPPFRLLLCLVCLLLPWLNPRASGPSTSVGPWLFSAVCVAIAFGAQRPAALRSGIGLGLMALSGWALARGGVSPEALALAAACLLLYMAGCIAAGGHGGQHEIVRAVAYSWLFAASISTGMALIQYFGVGGPLSDWINASAVGEAYANLRQRNQFASLTVLGMASLLWLARREPGRWPALAAIVWLAVGNAATTSRTGLLQMLLLGLLACVWPAPRRRGLVLWLAGLLAYVAAALILPWLLEIVTGVAGHRLWERVSAVDPCSSRMVLWSNVLHLIGQKPWLGWGWGNLDYAHYMTLYDGPRFCDILDNAHNLPLHLAVELGVPAALLVCAGVLWAVVRAKPWAEADPARQMAWAVLAIIAVHSLLEYPLWYGPFQIAFGLCLGLLWPAAAAAHTALQRWAGAARAASLALIAGIAAACAYAAWDYHRVSQIYLPPDTRAAGYEDPLPKIRKSWLFRNQALFAELTITPVTRANAQWTFDTSTVMLHYSPEPRVIEKLVDSAIILKRYDDALLHLARFRAAFPGEYTKWSETHSAPAAAGSAAKAQPAT